MIRSLTLKFIPLAGTLGLILALNWSGTEQGLKSQVIAEHPSIGHTQQVVSVLEQGEPVASKKGPEKVHSLDVNHSTAQELDALPGIGPVLAQRIIDHRSKVGAFQSINELEQVKGIGVKTLKNIRPLLKVSPHVVAAKP